MNNTYNTIIKQLHDVRAEKRTISKKLTTWQLTKNLTVQEEQQLQMKLERLSIIENHCKLNLPVYLRLSSEDIQSATVLLDQIEWLIEDIQLILPRIFVALNDQKNRLVPWQLSEVGSVILDTFWDQSKNPLLRTGAELLSTRLSTKGLETTQTNTTLFQVIQYQNIYSELMQKLDRLWIDLWWTQISKPLSSLPDLPRIEYIDLVQDIVSPAKKRWSVATLIAQFRTGKKTGDITHEINTIQQEMILMKTITIPEKRAKLKELEQIINSSF